MWCKDAVMADGDAQAGAEAGAETGTGECAGECAARGAALERAYVHDVYEQAGDDGPCTPAPAVRSFLSDLEPGSLVCDIGKET